MAEVAIIGIERIKKAIAVAAGFGKQIEAALADGKFTLSDAPAFVDDIIGLVTVAKEPKALLAEVKDLSAEETEELKQVFEEQFDLENDDTEKVVEQGIILICQTGELVSNFIAYGQQFRKKD